MCPTSRTSPRRRGLGILLVTLLPLAGWIQAGELEPAGPPAATMKTLAEVEARVPIGPGDIPVVIDAEGSYYLTGNLDCTGSGEICVRVEADYVVLDLNGYSVIGGDYGVLANSQIAIVVRNGVVRDATGAGLSFLSSSDVQLERVLVKDNGAYGASLGTGARVDDCAFDGNAVEGLSVGRGSIVRRSSSSNNGDAGFIIGRDSTISDCDAMDNGSQGFKCRDDGCTIKSCSARDNLAAGIEVRSACTVRNNSIVGDSHVAPTVVGLIVTGSRNRVEGNQIVEADTGLLVSGDRNVIARNTAGGNSKNYDIAAGNDVGPIGSAATATSPWANIQY